MTPTLTPTFWADPEAYFCRIQFFGALLAVVAQELRNTKTQKNVRTFSRWSENRNHNRIRTEPGPTCIWGADLSSAVPIFRVVKTVFLENGVFVPYRKQVVLTKNVENDDLHSTHKN